MIVSGSKKAPTQTATASGADSFAALASHTPTRRIADADESTEDSEGAPTVEAPTATYAGLGHEEVLAHAFETTAHVTRAAAKAEVSSAEGQRSNHRRRPTCDHESERATEEADLNGIGADVP